VYDIRQSLGAARLSQDSGILGLSEEYFIAFGRGLKVLGVLIMPVLITRFVEAKAVALPYSWVLC
jgi:hypothetical protein